MKTVKPFVFSFCVALLLTSFLSAQVATTSLHGSVYDPKGAAVTNATVTLRSSATGFDRTGTTDDHGGYEFIQIPPGTYIVTATAAGFAQTKITDLQLLVNLPATQNFTLKVSAVAEVVEVQGGTELVNNEDASIGNAFDSKQMLDLPFEGRDPVGILSLQPGVSYVGDSRNVDQSFDSRGGSVNGARSDQTNVTLDGVDDNDYNKGNAFQGALRTPLDSLDEFRVSTSNSNADSGRSSGAQVSLVTKSGTNALHGSLYEYNRSNIGEANDWFNEHSQVGNGEPNKPGQLIRNTFGTSIGGPIKKDRLFFFATYEGQRTRESLQVTRIVPSTLFRSGVIQYLDLSGNVVQLSSAQFQSMDLLGIGVNSAAQQVFNSYPSPNLTSAGDGLNFQGFTFPAATPSKLDTYIVKFDANLTSNQRAYVRGNLQNDHFINADAASAPQFPGQPGNITDKDNAKGLAVAHIWTISNNLINNARYGYVRPNLSRAGLQTQPFVFFRGLDDPVGISPTDLALSPVHNFIDDVTWRRGNHTFQFGGNWRIVNDIRSSNDVSFLGAFTNPSWLFGSGFTCGTGCAPNGFNPTSIGKPAVGSGQAYDLAASALAGVISEGFSNYNFTKTGSALPDGAAANRHFKSNEFEGYLQDSWRVRPNLTVTVGARYTLLQPPYETSGTQVGTNSSLNNFFSQRAVAMQQGQTYAPLLNFELIGQANGHKPYWAWDYKNIAPRLAFAWSPGGSGKTSVRGGFGIYYDHYGEGIINSFDKNGSFGLTTQLSNPAGVFTAGAPPVAPRFTGLNSLPPTCPSGCVMLPAPSGGFPQVPPSSLSTGGFSITWGMDDKIRTPYSEVIDFSLTHEFSHGFVVEGTYIGRLSHHLLQEDDLAMPLDIRDPKSGMDYFQAATLLSKAANKGTDIANLAPIAYWEDMFPGAAGQPGFGSFGSGCAINNSGLPGSSNTATQAVYDMWSCFVGNETTGLFFLDLPDNCLPSCSRLGPYAYFDPQWSSLYAWRSIGNAAYNGLQLMLRHKGHGLDVDFNYTYSKSIDVGSNAERINEFEGFGFASQVINAWAPKQLRAVSDFDTTQQFNSNWVYELPVGKGKEFGGGMHGVAQALFGGWTVSGIFRLTSGYPFSVGPGLGFWATNWELTSSAVLVGKRPKTGVFTDPTGHPNVFQGDPAQLGIIQNYNGDGTLGSITACPPGGCTWRVAYPGESGQRNNFRGPGYFGIDAGLGKVWNLTEHQAVRFSWETFNVTNTPRFDVGQLQNGGNNSLNSGSTFGEYGKTMTLPRVMQFALRYSF
jgi:Carboxypeptidase regulatory-like domain